ncbi:MAG: STAS/SEC14 domain-containing protein [Flavobacteriales bacterium]|nr:STAS/SEC14 domain-containing protein [Flavobacteriales bacterium]
MAFEPRTIETRLATMALTAPGFIEQRFREGVKLDREGFEENRLARQQLCGNGHYQMLSILQEDTDFELSVLGEDHFGAVAEIAGLSALGVVAQGRFIEGIVAIFFKYFPPQFPARTFNNEQDARAWLASLRAS